MVDVFCRRVRLDVGDICRPSGFQVGTIKFAVQCAYYKESTLVTKLGRPREFDMGEALEAMMNVFWEKGYEGTSLADLMEVTGLQKGSMYKAFADKQDMFKQALQHYIDGCHAEKRAILEAARSPLHGLELVLKKVVAEACGKDNDYRGCLAINSMLDVASHEEEIVQLLRATITSGEKFLAEIIEQGQEAGEIRSDLPARELAEGLYSYTAGMLATAKTTQIKSRTDRLVAFGVNMLRA